MKIGKISATEKTPTTNDEFYFWLEKDIEIRPFDIIKVQNNVGTKKSTSYAIVKDLFYITDSPGHIGNYVSSDFGDVESDPSTERLGLTYAVASIIHNTKEVYMPLKDGEIVEFANEEEIKDALGLKKIKNPIPAGFLDVSNNITVPIHLNGDFLIGPEGAHMNISGISGLATKTSYAMFLLQALQQLKKNTAIIILNVKGNDLLRLDEENPLLDDNQKEEWRKTGLECKPFENVKYFYPYKNDKGNCYSNTSCDSDALKGQMNIDIAYTFSYTYKHDKSNLDLLFSNIDDPTFTMESILNFISENKDFDDLDWDSFKEKLSEYTKKGQGKDITVQSWRKFARLIKKSINNQIFQKSLSTTKEKRNCHLSDKIKDINSGELFVVDIAKLEEQLQSFVFGDILQAVNDLKFGETDRAEKDIPERIIIFVDELNKYAAQNAPKNSPILRYLLEITERGRSEGIILFSAEQFKSAVHDRVKGNCSTDIYGRTNAIEISKPDYTYIPKTYTNMMTRLDKGELIIQHSVFKTLLKIKFPHPSYFQRDKEE